LKAGGDPGTLDTRPPAHCAATAP